MGCIKERKVRLLTANTECRGGIPKVLALQKQKKGHLIS